MSGIPTSPGLPGSRISPWVCEASDLESQQFTSQGWKMNTDKYIKLSCQVISSIRWPQFYWKVFKPQDLTSRLRFWGFPSSELAHNWLFDITVTLLIQHCKSMVVNITLTSTVKHLMVQPGHIMMLPESAGVSGLNRTPSSGRLSQG